MPDIPTDPLADLGGKHRLWAIPILRALIRLGGSAAPKEVRIDLRAHEAKPLTDSQWKLAVEYGHIGWSRNALRQRGLVGGARGVWEVTEAGRECAALHEGERADFGEYPEFEERAAKDEDVELESVQATRHDAYEVPVLRALAHESGIRKSINEDVLDACASLLLPGDFRLTKRHTPYRVGWALNSLRDAGQVNRATSGIWEITSAGRQRLEREGATWSFTPHQNSTAKVLPVDSAATTAPPASDSAPPDGKTSVDDTNARPFSLESWLGLSKPLTAPIHTKLSARLRPDLGPPPSGQAASIARNVILYGPHGTGKTYVARARSPGPSPAKPNPAPRVVGGSCSFIRATPTKTSSRVFVPISSSRRFATSWCRGRSCKSARLPKKIPTTSTCS